MRCISLVNLMSKYKNMDLARIDRLVQRGEATRKMKSGGACYELADSVFLDPKEEFNKKEEERETVFEGHR